MSNFQELIENSRVVICLGAGGVGKTTSSIALGMIAATAGKRVGLLSIDPAKRLADALGIKLSSELTEVDLPGIQAKGGSLKAAMLDQKVVFDEMVRRFAKNKKQQDRIFQNRLYISASNKFGGALEYMALAKMQTMIDSGAYDLIVLDTPPDAHAIDFLERPAILSGFMDSKVMTWLIKPIHLAQKVGLSKVMSMGEKLAGGIAEVTGLAALRVLAEFLVMMQDVIEGFNQAGRKVIQELQRDTTRFVLVTTLRSSPVRSAEKIAQLLVEKGFRLDGLLVNRCLPEEVAASITAYSPKDSDASASKVCLQALLNSHTVSQGLRRNLQERVVPLVSNPEQVVFFAEQRGYDIHSRDGMARLAARLSSP